MAIEPTKYETLYLVRPDISPEDLLTIQNRVEQSVAGNHGEMIRFEKWAERDLAYRIENYTRGTYYIAVYAADSGAVTDIERYFNLSKNNVLRFMTVKYIEEQKPADAVAGAPPQASGQEDQSAFQTPPLTPESEAEGGGEPPEQAAEQAQESGEPPEQAAEQAQESEEPPEQAAEQAQESEEPPEQAAEQATEQTRGSEEQTQENEEEPKQGEEQTEGGGES